MSLRSSARLNWYHAVVAIKDSWRARETLLTTSVIFAGICLLLLLLIGLKNGLVQKLYNDLLSSPTAIQGKWFATSADKALDLDGERALLRTLPPGVIIIPEITKIVSISTAAATLENVTLQATVPHDPLLAYYDASIANDRDRSLIVSPAVASELGWSPLMAPAKPLPATIVIQRSDGEEIVKAELKVTLQAVVGVDKSKSKSAYLSRYYMDQLEDFSQGEVVSEHGWPGRAITHDIGCQGYLAFMKRPYNAEDLNRLHLRGLKASLVEAGQPNAETASWRTLYGLLRPHDLQCYFLTSETQTEKQEQFLDFTSNEIEQITNADDVVLFWSEPVVAGIEGKRHRVVGISGSQRWLKTYFWSTRVRFSGGELLRVMLPHQKDLVNARLVLPGGLPCQLECSPVPEEIVDIGKSKIVVQVDRIIVDAMKMLGRIWHKAPDVDSKIDLQEIWFRSAARRWLTVVDEEVNSQREPLAVVPAELLSAIHRQKQGLFTFDRETQRFQRVNSPNKYFNGLFYARVLEEVPVVDEHLQRLGYSAISSKLRVLEMQGYASTLDLLVHILQTVAILLGIVTASVIFMEVTHRRRTSIGIMRIMGMPAQGVFLFVFVRAISVALLGWVLASIAAACVSEFLPLAYGAECRLTNGDYLRVLLGAVACSALGVFYHAWHAATRLDPYEAIKSGKIQ